MAYFLCQIGIPLAASSTKTSPVLARTTTWLLPSRAGLVHQGARKAECFQILMQPFAPRAELPAAVPDIGAAQLMNATYFKSLFPRCKAWLGKSASG